MSRNSKTSSVETDCSSTTRGGGGGVKPSRMTKKQPRSHISQISALKDNNRQLASALDELRRDYRKLQQENLQLKQERQSLLERVASMEKASQQRSFSELLQEAQSKLQEVQSSLQCVLKASGHGGVSYTKKSPPSPKKMLRFSSPNHGKPCTIYPRTPYPLHSVVGVVDGPQLSSTPATTEEDSGSIQLSPKKIDYSDSSSSSTKEPPTAVNKNDQEGQHKKKENNDSVISPIGESLVVQNRRQSGEVPPISDPDSTMDQLEKALSVATLDFSITSQRPRRKCVCLSLSYQEPTLNSKLRRGDPFTEQGTDWHPPNVREKRKKKTSTTHTQRKALSEVQNRM